MSNTAVFSFGRMNPITAGHEKLVNRVKSVAAAMDATPLIFLSHSQDPKKNPLDYLTKISLAQRAFGSVVQYSTEGTLIGVMKELSKSYSDVVMVVGSDRIEGFEKLLNAYNKKEYNFNSITIASAGSRDPDSDDVDGISGTKMREMAINNDIRSFTEALPKELRSMSSIIIQNVRKGMNYE